MFVLQTSQKKRFTKSVNNNAGKKTPKKQGLGGKHVPDRKKSTHTSANPTEGELLENKSFIHALKQRQKHEFLRLNKLDL